MNKPLPNSPLDSLTEDVFVKGSNSESVPIAGTERELSMPLQGSNPSPSDVPSPAQIDLIPKGGKRYRIRNQRAKGGSNLGYWTLGYYDDAFKWSPVSGPIMDFAEAVCLLLQQEDDALLGTPEGAYVSRGNEGKENPQVVPATEGNAPPRTQTKDPIYNAMEMDSDMSMSQHDVLTKCCGVGTRCQYEGTIDYCLECGKEGPEFLAEGEVYVDEGEGI